MADILCSYQTWQSYLWTTCLLCPRVVVSLSSCARVSLYPCPVVPACRCIPVQLCPRVVVSLYRCARVSLYLCTVVPACRCAQCQVSLPAGIIVPICHMEPTSHCAHVSLCPRIIVPTSHCAHVLLCLRLIMPTC